MITTIIMCSIYSFIAIIVGGLVIALTANDNDKDEMGWKK